MAETNIAYATDDSVFVALEALVLHNLPDFGSDGDGIINNNFVLAALKQGGSFDVVEGGLEFWHGIMNAENSNAKWQAHTASMSVNLQDPMDRLRYPIKTFTCSIPINELHAAMNKGRAMVKNWANTLTRQAKSTIPNLFNSAFWASSPATNEPNSIPSLFPTANTTGTIGGLSRSSHSSLQHRVDTTSVTDIGAEDGLKQLFINVRRTSVGSGGKDAPDIVIMSQDRFASLEAYLANLNRYRPDDKLAQLGFDTIKYNQVTISYENTVVSGSHNSIGANDVYGINRKHLFFRVLRDGNFRWDRQFIRVRETLSRAIYFRVFCNLTTNLPKAMFKMTNVTG